MPASRPREPRVATERTTMATLDQGYFYFFLRVPGPFQMGHMGWGLQFSANRWFFGSLENINGQMSVGENGDNDYWWAYGDSEAHMLTEMRTLDAAERLTNRPNIDAYSYYKKIPVTNAKPNDAEDAARGQSGYGLTFNNCLDNAVRVGDAYGVPVWSWTRHIPSILNVNMSPRGFFFNTLHQYNHVGL